MERGMKSDTTEMVLLGAAAAVIALVVAFSMMDDKMDDKGSRKRSLDDIVEEVENEVENDVEALKDAAKKAKPLVARVQELAEKVEAQVPPGSKTARVVNSVKGGFNRISQGASAAASLVPQNVKDDARAKVEEGVKEYGGRALNYFKNEIGKGIQQNLKPKPGGFFDKLFQTPKKQPLPDLEMDRYS